MLDLDGRLHTYDRDGKVVSEIATVADPVPPRSAELLRLDPASGALAITTINGVAIVGADGKSVDLLTELRTVQNLGFARDGELLVTASTDGTIRLWDLERGASAGLAWNGSGAATGDTRLVRRDHGVDLGGLVRSTLLQLPLNPERRIELGVRVSPGVTSPRISWDRHVPGDQPLQLTPAS